MSSSCWTMAYKFLIGFKSGEFPGHWSFVQKELTFDWSHRWVMIVVWLGAPSCIKNCFRPLRLEFLLQGRACGTRTTHRWQKRLLEDLRHLILGSHSRFFRHNMQLRECTGWHCSPNHYFCWKFDSWQRINIFPVSYPNTVILNIKGVKQLEGRFVWKNHSPPLGNATQLPLLAPSDPLGDLSGHQFGRSSRLGRVWHPTRTPSTCGRMCGETGCPAAVKRLAKDLVECLRFFRWLADENFGNARNAFLPASTRSVFERLTGLVTIFPVPNDSYRNPEDLCDMRMCGTGFYHANGIIAGGDTVLLNHF